MQVNYFPYTFSNRHGTSEESSKHNNACWMIFIRSFWHLRPIMPLLPSHLSLTIHLKVMVGSGVHHGTFNPSASFLHSKISLIQAEIVTKAHEDSGQFAFCPCCRWPYGSLKFLCRFAAVPKESAILQVCDLEDDQVRQILENPNSVHTHCDKKTGLNPFLSFAIIWNLFCRPIFQFSRVCLCTPS